jgi:hypothetical protein
MLTGIPDTPKLSLYVILKRKKSCPKGIFRYDRNMD